MTQIAAGTQHNVVPDTCRFVADVRTTDAYTNEETVEILRRALRSEVTPRSTRIRASALNAAHPLARATAATGRESYVSPTTSDMALMPFPSLKMGPRAILALAYGRRIRVAFGDRRGHRNLRKIHKTTG